ncbi:hypothetical protein PPERSA_03870 [Pseudocohnilembus persalinus]|uniref:Uncharacterized protein n=1 Tax=Pseudocohnilembus persalinus TaxID=266149 RepID=A0A0V0Q9C4_PSEPJ|nr:hypothetical protein PPERSA_03870 [Pseudocohnilembus persalinus]|eukprot:KRW98735.1 hypothetical protein PPERSA_03870 [Pseudocohnilembus persalinus]
MSNFLEDQNKQQAEPLLQNTEENQQTIYQASRQFLQDQNQYCSTDSAKQYINNNENENENNEQNIQVVENLVINLNSNYNNEQNDFKNKRKLNNDNNQYLKNQNIQNYNYSNTQEVEINSNSLYDDVYKSEQQQEIQKQNNAIKNIKKKKKRKLQKQEQEQLKQQEIEEQRQNNSCIKELFQEQKQDLHPNLNNIDLNYYDNLELDHEGLWIYSTTQPGQNPIHNFNYNDLLQYPDMLSYISQLLLKLQYGKYKRVTKQKNNNNALIIRNNSMGSQKFTKFLQHIIRPHLNANQYPAKRTKNLTRFQKQMSN